MLRKILPCLGLMVFGILAGTSHPADAQFLKSPYFEKVKDGQPLVVALHKASPPFCLIDEAGIPHGIDVEIANSLGQALGAEIQFVFPEFKDIVDGLHEGRWDLAIANLTITVPRATQVSFSHGYMEITQGALLDRRFIPRQIVEGEVKDVPIRSYADLKTIPGLVLGTWGHTTSSELLKTFHPGLEHKLYPDIIQAREALHQGEINALVADAPIIEFISNFFSEDRKRFKALTRPTTKERLAIAVRMGDPSFVDFLNEFIDELKASGQMDQWIHDYRDNTEWAGKVLR